MRAAVTLLAIVIGLAFIVGIYFNSAEKTSTPASAVQATQPVEAESDPAVAAAATDDAPAAPAASAAPATQPATATTQASQAQAVATAAARASGSPFVVQGAARPQGSTVGNSDPASPYALQVLLSPWGAAVSEVKLAHYTQEAMSDTPYTIQASIPTMHNGQRYHRYPFAARSITLNNQTIDLEAVAWKLTAPGVYQLDLLQDDKPAVRLTRRYSLKADANSYEIVCRQSIANLTDAPLTAVWEQSIQAEQPMDIGSYMGDQRVLYAGYFDSKYDPQHRHVVIEDAYIHHPKALKAWQDKEPFFWPVRDARQQDRELVWFGETNRYFASVVHRPLSKQGQVQQLDDLFPTLGFRVVDAYAPAPSSDAPASKEPSPAKPVPTFIYALTSKPLTIAPQSQAELDLAFFAGPRESSLFELQPYRDLGFGNLIRYELSCAFCTFQWLAKGLLQFLKGIHFILRDWAMAIIILVLVVRVILHPITKKSQIAMTKMSKQMATLQPEMEKIKKKYADDQTKQNQEIMKLYREKGINPAGMLGCLPMFLQTPIWIALYAMLYFAIELRHEPAFYGIFQAISGGKWAFLADLSSADNFLHFSKSFTLNLYFIKPQFAGINIIPLLMAVFFYFQQVLMMPPAANEQQAQQQKIGKYMTLMVPIFLYSAPSGLTLYMLASSIGGMIDGWIVRRHIKQQEEAGTLFAPKARKPAKPGGLWDRIQKRLEEQQKKIAEAQKHAQQDKPRKQRKK